MRRVLNVGGNSKDIPLPAQYTGFEHVLLDIDPSGAPDIVCDARQMTSLEPAQFDAVYCSHNLEHYHRHDVPRVLSGFQHVLRTGGFAQIRVPDIEAVMKSVVARGLDVEDTLYQSAAGPISVLDVVYGYGVEIERSGNEFFAHKTGFSPKSLTRALQAAGFGSLCHGSAQLEVNVVAFKGTPDPALLALLSLPR